MTAADVVAFNKVGIINAYGGDREDWGKAQEEIIIRGIPFSGSMARFLAGTLERPVTQALELLRPDPHLPPGIRAARRAQYKVITAVLRDGITDVDDCRRAVKMTPWAFAVAAEGGIRALRAALERE